MVLEQGLSWSGKEQNCAFLNLGDGRFTNVSASTAADYPDDARALAIIDWNLDGALDLVIKNRTAPRIRLLLNQVGTNGSWVRFQLVGTGNSNRDAIGARVRLLDGDAVSQVAAIRAGDGYLSQNSRLVHFGLASNAADQQVEVIWPDGSKERFGAVATGQTWRLVQGTGLAEAVARPSAMDSFMQRPTKKLEGATHGDRRIVMVDRLPMEAFPLPSFDNAERTVADLKGGPVLISLWGLTCANCFRELSEFRDHADELAAAGLTIVPFSTDGEDQQAEARERIESLGHGAHAGPTSARQFEAMQLLFTELFGASAPSMLPTSLLLDPQGRVCIAYQGAVSVEQLIADAELVAKSQEQERFAGRLQQGRWLTTRLRGFAGLARSFRSNGFADLASYYEALAERDKSVR